jgi:hypothetical protein
MIYNKISAYGQSRKNLVHQLPKRRVYEVCLRRRAVWRFSVTSHSFPQTVTGSQDCTGLEALLDAPVMLRKATCQDAICVAVLPQRLRCEILFCLSDLCSNSLIAANIIKLMLSGIGCHLQGEYVGWAVSGSIKEGTQVRCDGHDRWRGRALTIYPP